MYGFGENQLYTTSKRFLETREWLAHKYRVGFPWFSGRFGLSLGVLPVLPHPTHVVHKLGKPVQMPKRVVDGSKITEEQVDFVFGEYKKSVMELFDANKDDLLPPDVAARGLKIEWLGAKE